MTLKELAILCNHQRSEVLEDLANNRETTMAIGAPRHGYQESELEELKTDRIKLEAELATLDWILELMGVKV